MWISMCFFWVSMMILPFTFLIYFAAFFCASTAAIASSACCFTYSRNAAKKSFCGSLPEERTSTGISFRLVFAMLCSFLCACSVLLADLHSGEDRSDRQLCQCQTVHGRRCRRIAPAGFQILLSVRPVHLFRHGIVHMIHLALRNCGASGSCTRLILVAPSAAVLPVLPHG
nr:MAG TPA: hypothetical protein [Caudoviricetes sp.]